MISINSHPLIRPGMSMADVRKVIVLTDELLDYPEVESYASHDDPLDLLWRTYVALEEAGSVSFRLSGGECGRTFGVRGGPIEMAIGDFTVFKDDPALIFLGFHTDEFYIVFSQGDGEWAHWRHISGATWEKVERETVVDASSYWLWNGKLHRGILSVLKGGLPEDISVDETLDGNLRIHVTLGESYVNL